MSPTAPSQSLPSPQPQPLRIAIIGGSGVIGQRHSAHVSSNPSTTLIAIVDPSPSALETATRHSTALYPSIAALLFAVHPRPDAAIVCTPNATHVALAAQLAQAGIHLLVEKPISTDAASGRALVATARDHGVHLLIGHHRRFNPYVLATKRLLSSTDSPLGAVTAVSGLWTALKPESYFAGGAAAAWRGSKRGGGGPVLLNFIHEIDLLHFLFGPVTRVHAEKVISRRRQQRQQPLVEDGKGRGDTNGGDGGGDSDGDVDDAAEEGAALTLRFASGVVGTFVVCDNVASPHSFEAGTGENPLLAAAGGRTLGGGVDVYRIFGTEGTLSVPDMVLSTYDRGDDGVGKGGVGWEHEMGLRRLKVEGLDVPPFERQLDHFVRVCRGEVEPSCSGEDGLRALVVCEAVRRALDMRGGGGTVEIGSMEQEINGGCWMKSTIAHSVLLAGCLKKHVLVA